MDGIPQEQQQTPAEPKKNALLEEVEFGVGGVLLLHFLGIDKYMANLL